jgi:hypothetical protein
VFNPPKPTNEVAKIARSIRRYPHGVVYDKKRRKFAATKSQNLRGKYDVFADAGLFLDFFAAELNFSKSSRKFALAVMKCLGSIDGMREITDRELADAAGVERRETITAWRNRFFLPESQTFGFALVSVNCDTGYDVEKRRNKPARYGVPVQMIEIINEACAKMPKRWAGSKKQRVLKIKQIAVDLIAKHQAANTLPQGIAAQRTLHSVIDKRARAYIKRSRSCLERAFEFTTQCNDLENAELMTEVQQIEQLIADWRTQNGVRKTHTKNSTVPPSNIREFTVHKRRNAQAESVRANKPAAA